MHGGTEDRLLRYRNRDIFPEDIDFIKRTVRSFSRSGRVAISRVLCELWGWKTPDGRLKDCACRYLLLHLEEKGFIRLPPRRGFGQRKKVDTLPLPITPRPIESGNLQNLEVRPIDKSERLSWRMLIDRYHYLGDKILVGEHILYFALLEGEIVGCLGWGAAALHVPLRDEFIGWSPEQKRCRLQGVAGNHRFLILPHVKVKNLGSRILSLNLKRLSRDWRERYKHPLHLAETFVDMSRFKGTVYRAANWTYLGLTSGKGKRGIQYTKHGIKKAIFVYPLCSFAKRELLK